MTRRRSWLLSSFVGCLHSAIAFGQGCLVGLYALVAQRANANLKAAVNEKPQTIEKIVEVRQVEEIDNLQGQLETVFPGEGTQQPQTNKVPIFIHSTPLM